MPRPNQFLRLGPLPPNHFKPPKGEKPIYLPDFVITLLRTPLAPPTWASFHTPLWFSKLDIKDYLYHGYGLKVLSVRSYVIQRKVRMDKESKRRPVQNRWFRPQSLKKMTVELAQTGEGQGPFVWPEDPEDKSPWQKEQFDKGRELAEADRERRQEGATMGPTDGEDMAKQAKALLEGKEKWKPGWKDYGVGGPGAGATART